MKKTKLVLKEGASQEELDSLLEDLAHINAEWKPLNKELIEIDKAMADSNRDSYTPEEKAKVERYRYLSSVMRGATAKVYAIAEEVFDEE